MTGEGEPHPSRPAFPLPVQDRGESRFRHEPTSGVEEETSATLCLSRRRRGGRGVASAFFSQGLVGSSCGDGLGDVEEYRNGSRGKNLISLGICAGKTGEKQEIAPVFSCYSPVYCSRRQTRLPPTGTGGRWCAAVLNVSTMSKGGGGRGVVISEAAADNEHANRGQSPWIFAPPFCKRAARPRW